MASEPSLTIDWLLEAVYNRIHVPVKLRLDRLTHTLTFNAVEVAGLLVKVVADCLLILLPVGPIKGIDAIVWEQCNVLIDRGRSAQLLINIGNKAGSELHHLVDVVNVELFFHLRKAIEHLNRSL